MDIPGENTLADEQNLPVPAQASPAPCAEALRPQALRRCVIERRELGGSYAEGPREEEIGQGRVARQNRAVQVRADDAPGDSALRAVAVGAAVADADGHPGQRHHTVAE